MNSVDRVATIRGWVVEQVTLIGDNHEPWYTALRNAALSHDEADAVTDALRMLIRTDPATARDLLFELLDLEDRSQAEMLAAHYRED